MHTMLICLFTKSLQCTVQVFLLLPGIIECVSHVHNEMLGSLIDHFINVFERKASFIDRYYVENESVLHHYQVASLKSHYS